MDREQWVSSQDPRAMLDWLGGVYAAGVSGTGSDGRPYEIRVSERKLRLLAVACCRDGWLRRAADDRISAFLDAHESYADGWMSLSRFVEIGDAAFPNAAWDVTGPADHWLEDELSWANRPPEREAAILRDTVGDPFTPPAYVWMNERLYPRPARERTIGDDISDLTPVGWLTPTALSLARAAYDERLPDGVLDPARLLVLSDALEEAGCDDEAMLAALRSPGDRYRGFWVLDLILGKG